MLKPLVNFQPAHLQNRLCFSSWRNHQSLRPYFSFHFVRPFYLLLISRDVKDAAGSQSLRVPCQVARHREQLIGRAEKLLRTTPPTKRCKSLPFSSPDTRPSNTRTCDSLFLTLRFQISFSLYVNLTPSSIGSTPSSIGSTTRFRNIGHRYTVRQQQTATSCNLPVKGLAVQGLQA
jgi:hypothetical protein